MPQFSIDEAMTLALQHCQKHQLQQAETIYRQVLQQQPHRGDAWANLGMVLQQMGRIEESILCHERALRLKPPSVELLNNLGGALLAAGRLPEAERRFRQAISLQPESADTYVNLGTLLRQQGRLQEAAACCAQALALRPDHLAAHFNLGNVLKEQGKTQEAIDSFKRAIALQPHLAQAHDSIGQLLLAQNRPAEAAAYCRQAVALRPDVAEAHLNLGTALAACQRHDEAIDSYRRALALRPDYAEAHFNLGNSLRQLDRIGEAIDNFERAAALKPAFVEAQVHLAGALMAARRLDEAIACYRRALAVCPDTPLGHSNLLFAMNYHPQLTAEHISEEAQRWWRRFGAPLAAEITPYANSGDPQRRLRIGYVSPDLRQHVIGRLMQSILPHHNRQQFEIVCYSDAARAGPPDAQTQRLREHSDLWRDSARLDDAQLAELIRQDAIDILVDLAAHSANNRLLVFARKPSPVQVTYLGYPGTTGLETMDYRLTDPYLSPPAQTAEGPEKLVHLPTCYWCYAAPDDAPPVNELPALRDGQISFASFNSSNKVNDSVILLWAQILRAVPGSRLVLLLGGGQRNAHLYQPFERLGIDSRRIVAVEPRPVLEFLRLHHDVDIALDPFPYHGHTTSYDALYMGVPVVTLAGERAMGRAGVSILSNLGLTELIAHSPEEYVQIATHVAGDLPRLAELRRTLRDRMRKSPLMDARRFVHDLEIVYRKMWHTWCGTRAVS